MHFCMGAYGEYSSRLLNFGGFKLVTNLKETKEAKCKGKYYPKIHCRMTIAELSVLGGN